MRLPRGPARPRAGRREGRRSRVSRRPVHGLERGVWRGVLPGGAPDPPNARRPASPSLRRGRVQLRPGGPHEGFVGDAVVYADRGTLVFKPRDQWHTFWNAGDGPCRILEIISPGGFERLFEEAAEPLESTAPALDVRYG